MLKIYLLKRFSIKTINKFYIKKFYKICFLKEKQLGKNKNSFNNTKILKLYCKIGLKIH